MTYLITAISVALHLAEPAQQLSSTIEICPIYRSTVAEMLRYSPTFQRQYSRLVRTPYLRVEIAPSLLGGGPADSAVTRIARRSAGVEAEAKSPAGSGAANRASSSTTSSNSGVDLASIATRSHRVPSCGSDALKRSAIAAGRQVASEVRRGRARDGT